MYSFSGLYSSAGGDCGHDTTAAAASAVVSPLFFPPLCPVLSLCFLPNKKVVQLALISVGGDDVETTKEEEDVVMLIDPPTVPQRECQLVS